MEQFFNLVKNYGVNVVLVFGLLWMNARLNSVESRLFDCYEKRVLHADINDRNDNGGRLVAVLPSEMRIRKKSKH